MKKGVLILLLLIILGGVGAGVYFGTQKKDDDDEGDGSESTGTKPKPSPDFIIHKTGDRIFGDLSSTPTEDLKSCQELCKKNQDCIGVSYNKTEKNCFLKGTTGGGSGGAGPLKIEYVSSPYQFYYKNVPGYEVKGAGDRIHGDIEGMPVTKESLKDCATVCNSKTNCVGFSYNSHANVCYAKKADGLEKDYKQNDYQFYDKNK